MTRVRIERVVDVAAPARTVWDYVTDWPRQAEWVPNTHVEKVDHADRLGGRFRAWTGIGAPGPTRGTTLRGLGFWDPMTITAWETAPEGGGRCEVLHRGIVVKGEGEFTVLPQGEHTSRFVWAEIVVLPFGRLGTVAWRFARPVVERVIDHALRTMRDRVERGQAGLRP
jgi:hypothetical protein